jgi:hypothetical protein
MVGVVNYDKIENDFSTPVADGTYDAYVKEIEMKADDTGDAFMNVSFELIGTGVKGRLISNRVYYTGPKAWQHKKWHKTLTNEEIATGTTFDEQMYCGRQVTLTVTTQTKGDKTYTNVRNMQLKN